MLPVRTSVRTILSAWIVALMLTFLLTPPTARACTCGHPSATTPTFFDQATAVLYGAVVGIEVQLEEIEIWQGHVITHHLIRARFQVSRSWKGVDSSPILVRTGYAGGSCGFPFEFGRHYLVFASPSTKDELGTDICSGTTVDGEQALDTMGKLGISTPFPLNQITPMTRGTPIQFYLTPRPQSGSPAPLRPPKPVHASDEPASAQQVPGVWVLAALGVVGISVAVLTRRSGARRGR